MSYASSLYLTGAEVGLSLLGLVLLLVSAWSGPKSGRLLTIITGAALLAAVGVMRRSKDRFIKWW